MNQLDAATCARPDQLESLVHEHLRGRVHQLQLQVGADGIVLRGWAQSYTPNN